jgi:hypothetical protein
MKKFAKNIASEFAHPDHWYRKLAGAAVAAGAGVLAAPSDAQAQIVVWTPNISTTGGQTGSGVSNIFFDFVSGTAQTTSFGSAQFQLQRSYNAAFFYAKNVNNHVIGNQGGAFFYPAKMAMNDPIGANPASQWLVAAGTRFQTLGFAALPYGNWQPLPSNGFLGLRFGDGLGNFNYGWAEISIDANADVTLSRFAYDTVVNEQILAGQTSSVPEPSSAALLVLGAAGMAAYRKRRNKTTESQPETTTAA